MKFPHQVKIELTDGLADQYIRLSKTKGEILIIEKLCDILESIKHPDDEKFIDHFKWTTFCIWESIYINYHKLFADAMKAEDGQKVNKFKINAGEFFKTAPKNLKDLHEKILSIRHHYFVHGGTELYETYNLVADIQISQNGTRIQLNVEGLKEPAIDDADIPLLRELTKFLLETLENKLSKCNEKLGDFLHLNVEKLVRTI
jgi:hypothetical protein